MKAFDRDLDLEVVGIMRNGTVRPDRYYGDSAGFQFDALPDYQDNNATQWDVGVYLTGSFGRTTYVDDSPNASSLVLQADYMDGEKKDIPILPLNTNMTIVPRYDNGKEETGKGDLLVTVGRTLSGSDPAAQAAIAWANGAGRGAILKPSDLDINFPLVQSGGNSTLTARHVYEEVWHVTKVEPVQQSPYPYLNFWQADTASNWGTALAGSGAKLRVSYTNGNTREITWAQAVSGGVVWWNENPPVDIYVPLGIYNLQETYKVLNTTTRFRNYYTTWTEPKIRINYRGAVTELEVDIYNAFTGVEAVLKDGSELEVDMRQEDNDIGGRNATWFAGKINVEAVYTSIRGETRKDPLSFDETKCIDGTSSTTAGNPADPNVPNSDGTLTVQMGTPPVATAMNYYNRGAPGIVGQYTMNFGKAPWWDRTASTPLLTGFIGNWEESWNVKASERPRWYVTSIPEISAFGIVNSARNNGSVTPVTVYYKTQVPADGCGVRDPRVATAQVSGITWRNIRVRQGYEPAPTP